MGIGQSSIIRGQVPRGPRGLKSYSRQKTSDFDIAEVGFDAVVVAVAVVDPAPTPGPEAVPDWSQQTVCYS